MSDAHVPPPPVSDTMVAGALGALRESIEDLRKRPVALDPDALKSVIRAALAEATAPPPNLLVTAIRRLELVERRLESLEQAVRSGGASLSRTSPVVSETPAPTVLPALDADAVADALARRLAAAASLAPPPVEVGALAPPTPPVDPEAVATRVAEIVAGHLHALPPAAQPAPVVENLTESIRAAVSEVLDQRQLAVAADVGAATEGAIAGALVPVLDLLAHLKAALEEATTPVEAVAAVSRLEAGVGALAEALEDDREHQTKLLNAGFDDIGERVERLTDQHPDRVGYIAETVAELKDSIAAQTANIAALPAGPDNDKMLEALEAVKSYLEELSGRPSMLSEVDALRRDIGSVHELIVARAETIEHRLAERFDLAVAGVTSRTEALSEQLASFSIALDRIGGGDEMQQMATSLSRVVSMAHDLSTQIDLIKERMDSNAAAIELSRRAADAGEGARSAVHGMRTDLAAQLATSSATLDQAAGRLAALIESSTAVLAERLDALHNQSR